MKVTLAKHLPTNQNFENYHINTQRQKNMLPLFKNFSSSRSIWNTGIALCTFPANETALEQWRIIIVKIRIPSVSYKLPETIS
jgi:hypothetical protein